MLALELGLPRNAKAIAELIRRGKTRQLHYGLANGRPFVLMASAGFDAEVVHAVPLSLNRRLGKLAYVITALRTGFKRKSASLKVILDGEELTGKLAVASNARHYGGPFVICPGGATDPGLHMLVLERDDPWSSFCYGVALLMGRIHKAKGALVRPFKTASISGNRCRGCTGGRRSLRCNAAGNPANGQDRAHPGTLTRKRRGIASSPSNPNDIYSLCHCGACPCNPIRDLGGPRSPCGWIAHGMDAMVEPWHDGGGVERLSVPTRAFRVVAN